MNPAKIEKLAAMAEQSAARIGREAITLACEAFSIFRDEVINSQPEGILSQPINEREGNKSVTLPSRSILTAEQLAEVLQVKASTVYKWAEIGQIPSFKFGTRLRFNLDEVLESGQNKIQLSLPELKPALKENKLTMIK